MVPFYPFQWRGRLIAVDVFSLNTTPFQVSFFLINRSGKINIFYGFDFEQKRITLIKRCFQILNNRNKQKQTPKKNSPLEKHIYKEDEIWDQSKEKKEKTKTSEKGYMNVEEFNKNVGLWW